LQEFPHKKCTRSGLDKLLRKIDIHGLIN